MKCKVSSPSVSRCCCCSRLTDAEANIHMVTSKQPKIKLTGAIVSGLSLRSAVCSATPHLSDLSADSEV